jgi:hypothetical protein
MLYAVVGSFGVGFVGGNTGGCLAIGPSGLGLWGIDGGVCAQPCFGLALVKAEDNYEASDKLNKAHPGNPYA